MQLDPVRCDTCLTVRDIERRRRRSRAHDRRAARRRGLPRAASSGTR